MRKLAVFIIALTTVTGCTVGPDYVKPDVDIPGDWRYSIEDASGTVNALWWEQFDDPVLDALINEALVNNKDVRIAAARVEEFAARVDITRSGFYPQVGYDGAAGRNRSPLETAAGGSRINDSYLAALNVGWELDVWGRIRRATEAARAQLLAEEEVRRTVILTLVSSVAGSYINLRSLDRQLEIAIRTLQSRGETVDLFETKFEGGVVSALEVAQVRSEYEQAAVRIPSLERQIALQENALSILLGHNPGAIPRGKAIDDLMLPQVPEGLPSELLARRPDIQRAEQDLIAANAQIGVARSQYFPTISLSGLFGYASDELSDLLQSSSEIWGIGADALGPIFTGGRISSQVRATEAVQRQALVGYAQTVQAAFREVDDALISNIKRRDELVAQGRQVAALVDYAHYAQIRYDEGQVSYIEVLDSQRRLFDAELLYTQSENEVHAAMISIYKAMGGGWVEQAEAVANEADYAPEEDEQESFNWFMKRTQPEAVEEAAAGS
ncbi:MAG: efflux transporter outer membrane subunit [Gammaproteobacteria bacterium]